MRYKKFKGTKMSEIGLGCWAFGGTWNNTDDEKSIATIRKAIDEGITFFDTAPVYGFGHSEKILGRAIKGYDRKNLVIASKCGLVWDEDKKISNNLSKESILREIDKSLERLEIDYIDIYQLHWPDENTDIEETIEALNILLESGKVKSFGVSNFSLENFNIFNEKLNLLTYQGLYNMLEHNPTSYHNIPLEYKTKNEILPYCRENDIAYLPYSPLMQGLLAGAFEEKDNFDENDSRFANPKLIGEEFKKYYNAALEIEAFSKSINKPIAQVAINWLTVQNEVGPVICGAQTPDQIKENIQSSDWQLTNEEVKRISKILRKHGVS